MNKVQRPLKYGGLGIKNLELQGWALRICWLWLQKTDDTRPWHGLPVEVPHNAQALFEVAVNHDRQWGIYEILDRSLVEWKNFAPRLLGAIPLRLIKHRTVAQAVDNRTWVRDIQGALTVQILIEYLQTWDLVEALHLQHDVQDQHVWRLTQSDVYTSKSAYEAFFFWGNHQICSMEKDLEVLGSTALQVFLMASHQQSMLDRGAFSKA